MYLEMCEVLIDSCRESARELKGAMVRAKKAAEQEAKRSEKLKTQEEERRKALTKSIPKPAKALKVTAHPIHEFVADVPLFRMKVGASVPALADLAHPYVMTGLKDIDMEKMGKGMLNYRAEVKSFAKTFNESDLKARLSAWMSELEYRSRRKM